MGFSSDSILEDLDDFDISAETDDDFGQYSKKPDRCRGFLIDNDHMQPRLGVLAHQSYASSSSGTENTNVDTFLE